MTQTKQAPFGTWKSPVTAEIIAAESNSSGIEEVFLDQVTSKVYFAQARPSEGGRSALVSAETAQDIIPRHFNARTRVHEYGGGAAVVRNGIVYFSNMEDNRVYKTNTSNAADKPDPVAVTPESRFTRFASFSVHPAYNNLLIATCEDHVDEGWHPWRVRTYLVLIDTSSSTITRIWTGTETPKGKGAKKKGIGRDGKEGMTGGEGKGENDFFAHAQWSEDGKRIVWQQWAHPDLSWQSSNIYVASVSLSPNEPTKFSISNVQHISGAHRSIASIDPRWISPTTGVFLSDEGGWQNPWIFTLDPNIPNSKPRVERAIPHVIEQEFGGPQWFLSYKYSGALSSSKVFFTSYRGGRSVLSIIDFSKSQKDRKISEIKSGFVDIQYVHGNGQKVVFLGKSAAKGFDLVELSLDSSGKTVMKSLLPPAPPHPILREEYISPPIYHRLQLKAVPEFNLPGRVCHVTYYAPKNPKYSGGIGNEKPPVIVWVHGGPSSIESCALSWRKQFWTSRGFAHIDINFGGSTGFGRAFQETLDKQWGIIDVYDAHASVLSLSSLNLVDHTRAAIHGGSGGGYTTFKTATTLPDAYVVGSPQYGISDLYKLDQVLHKQEYFICERLLGGAYEDCPQVWKDRSPIYHADKIKMPLLILQGEIDTIVPLEQQKIMVEQLKKQGNEVEFVVFPGEGHGWRKASSIQESLEKELDYFSKALGL